MAFYYVKSGGTATGDVGRETTARTGTFEANANNYASVSAALAATTAPTGSDVIICSSTHSINYGVSTTLTFPSDGNPIVVMSADDSNQENYLRGAVEGTTTGSLISDRMIHYKGVNQNSSSAIGYGGVNGCSTVQDLQLTLNTSNDSIQQQDDGSHLRMIDLDINFASTGQSMRAQNGGTVEWFGGVTSGTTAQLFSGGMNNGGGTILVKGVDLTAVTGAASFLLLNMGNSQAGDDTINVKFSTSQLSTGLIGFVEEEFENQGHNALFTNCGNTTDSNEEFQVFQRNWGGDVEDQDDSGIHRNESLAYPDGTKVSLKFTSRSVCTPQRPIVFDAPTKFSELATASTDTIRIYFTVENGTTLTDQDVWAEVIYPDGTTAEQPNFLTNQHDNPLSTGTTHTTDSGSDWRDGGSALTSFNEYFMDLDTSADVGSNGVPVIRIYVGIASKTIYFDTSFDLVA